jgi:hypothetical protein
LGAVPASPKVVDGRRRGAIPPTPSRCDLERRLDQRPPPTGSRRHACHRAVPIQENKVPNLQPRDKSTTRNSLCLEGLTFKATLSADAAGIAPPASPRLLWSPAAAVASTASPFICGAPPSPDASLRVIAAIWRSLAMAVAEIASFGGRRQWRQARKPLLLR